MGLAPDRVPLVCSGRLHDRVRLRPRAGALARERGRAREPARRPCDLLEMHLMLRIFRCASLAYLLLASSAVAACKTVPAPPARSTTRAMWVTRWDFKTKDDVLRIAESCAQLGLNTINFQVRGNATAFYRSKLEPWAEQFDFADPGFDPLATMLE